MSLRGGEVLARVFELMGPEALYVCANGYVSREACAQSDRPQSFYMLGSMGLAAPIALGLALAQPSRRVVVLDGDGNVLMGLGGLALVGSEAPPRFTHLCLDNGVYASTGNQPSLAGSISLEGVAREAGYRSSSRVEDAGGLEAGLLAARQGLGPSFLRVMIETEPHPRTFPRVPHTPLEIRDRFRRSLEQSP